MDLLADLSNLWVKPPLATLIIFLMSGWAFCPLLALWARLAEAAKHRIFYNNLSRQICQAGLAFAIPSLLGFGTLAAFQLSKGGAMLAAGEISALSGFFLLQLTSLVSWKRLRKAAPAQIALLALTAFAALSAAALLLSSLISWPERAGLDLAQEATRHSLFNVDYYAAWAFTGWLALIGLALASAWSTCWLLMRRNRDDFGRDYYNFAAGRGCGLAFTAGTASLLACAALLVLLQAGCFAASLPLLAQPLAALAVITLHVVCCVLWFLAARAAAPLRHKVTLWISLPLWVVALILACQIAYSYYLAAIAQKL